MAVTAAFGFHASDARALGADGVLHKPVDPDDLLAVVGRYCPPGAP